MIRQRLTLLALVPALALAVLCWSPSARGEDAPAKPEKMAWSSSDIDGKALTIPAGDRACMLLFVMAGQAQSKQAIAEARKILAAAGAVQVVVFVSGQNASDNARAALREGQLTCPAVADPDYAASGKMSVHVWPTTLVLKPNGELVAHLAGLSPSYAHDLEVYLQLAQGKLDQAALEQRLVPRDVVGDSPHQKAARHLQLGQRLLERAQAEQAQKEFAEGLKIEPKETSLQLGMARAQLVLGQSEQALATLKAIDPAALPAWQLSALRGWALVAQGQWDQARATLLEAVKLNPQPSEAYYLLGRVYQQQKDYEHAAEAFRHAFESAPAGRQVTASMAGK